MPYNSWINKRRACVIFFQNAMLISAPFLPMRLQSAQPFASQYVWSRWMVQFLKSTQESKAKENNENKPRERWVEEFENPVNASQHASPIIELCVTNYHLACRNLYHCPQWFIRELTWDKYALCRDVNWNGLEDLPVAIRSANTDCSLHGVNF